MLIAALASITACGVSAFASDHWSQAKSSYDSGNYRQALTELRTLPANQQASASVHYLIGMCYKNMGNASAARSELTWCSRYANDGNIQVMASDALSDLGSSAKPGPSSASSTAKGGGTKGPPPVGLINGSISDTIKAAAANGWRPCTNPECLNANTSGWHHMEVEGHPASDLWVTFQYEGGSGSFNQQHIGHTISKPATSPPQDQGACSTCHGTGWVAQ